MERRTLLASLAGLGLGAAGAHLVWRKARRKSPDPVRAGFIYVGSRQDLGYNEAHARAAVHLQERGLIELVEEENVPEDESVVAVMERMIADSGVQALFPTSYGYFPYVLEVARQHPAVSFFHTGGLIQPGHPANVSAYFGYVDDGLFLAGIIAAHASKTSKLGFVAAKDIPHARRNINAFTMGARLVAPGMRTMVRFTGEWYLPTVEEAMANELVDDGVDVIACHVDSPRAVVSTCEARGAYAIGYHSNQSRLAPTRYLTSVEWNWYPMCRDYIERLQSGRTWPRMRRGSLRDGTIVLSPVSDEVSGEARLQVNDVLSRMMHGNFHVYSGLIRDNAGEVIIPAGLRRPHDDPWLETTNWFVEGVEA